MTDSLSQSFDGRDLAGAEGPDAPRTADESTSHAAAVSGREAAILVGQSPVGAIVVERPAPGTSVDYSVTPGQNFLLSFDPDQARFFVEGDNIVLGFDDNGDGVVDSRAVFLNLAAAADEADAPLFVIGEAQIAISQLLSQAEALSGEGAVIETAAEAGPAPLGGGGSTYGDNLGDVLNLLVAQGALDGTELAFSTLGPDEDPLLDDLDGSEPLPVTEVSTIDGTIAAALEAGFEDWQPAQHLGDSGEVPMRLDVSFSQPEGDSEVLNFVTISNIPEGVRIFVGDPGNPANEQTGPTIDVDAADIGDIYVLPPADSDADIPLTLTANITDTSDGLTGTTDPLTVVGIVDAVADKPSLSVVTSAPTRGDGYDDEGGQDFEQEEYCAPEESLVGLAITATFSDHADGSELHTIVIGNVPSDWVLVDAGGLSEAEVTRVAGEDGFDSFILTVTGGSFDGTVQFDPRDWTSSRLSDGSVNEAGDAAITVQAVAEEVNLSGGELSDLNNLAVTEAEVHVCIDEDLPEAAGGSLIYDETPGVDPGSDDVAALNAAISAGLENAYAAIYEGDLPEVLGQAQTTVSWDVASDGSNDAESAEPSQYGVSFNYDGESSGLFTGGADDLQEVFLYSNAIDPTIVWGLTESGDLVFAGHLDPDLEGEQATFTFVQFQQINHPDAGAAEGGDHDESTLSDLVLTYRVSDDEGDLSSAVITVTIEDDGPTAADATIQIDETPGLGTVGDDVQGADETDLELPEGLDLHDGAEICGVAVTSLSYDFGTDADGGDIALTAADGDPHEGTDSGLVTAADGESIFLFGDGTTVEGRIGGEDGEPAFTIYLDEGQVWFVQHVAIGHDDDQSTDEPAFLQNLYYTVEDGDGDWTTAAINIEIQDDGPVARPTIEAAALQESTLTDENANNDSVAGTLDYDGGKDGAEVTDIRFASAADPEGDSTFDGSLTSGGAAVSFGTAQDDGLGNLVLTATAPLGEGGAAVDVLTVTVNKQTGDYVVELHRPLDHPDGDQTGASDPIRLWFDYSITDGDGDVDESWLQIDVWDDGPSAGSTIAEAPLRESDLHGEGSESIHGSLDFDFGADGAGSFTSLSFTGASDPEADSGATTLTSNGLPVVFGAATLVDDMLVLTGSAGGDDVIEVKVDRLSGEYWVTLLGPLDHPDAGESGADDVLELNFGFTLADSDSPDSATGNLVVTVEDGAPTTIEVEAVSVDEDDLPSGSDGSDATSVTAVLGVEFGADGAGSVIDANGPVGLTSNGAAVTYSYDPDTQTLTASAGGEDVFTVVFDATAGDYGEFVFTLLGQLDHPISGQDLLNLGISFTATDGDGDFVEGTAMVQVVDDVPTAQNNAASVVETGIVTGNLITDAGPEGTDVVGADQDGVIGKIVHNGVIYELSADGTSLNASSEDPAGPEPENYSFDGTTLTIESTELNATLTVVMTGPDAGDYSYQSVHTDHAGAGSDTCPPVVEESFQYSLRDADGDSSMANLTIAIEPGVSEPTVQIQVDAETGSIVVKEDTTGIVTFTAQAQDDDVIIELEILGLDPSADYSFQQILDDNPGAAVVQGVDGTSVYIVGLNAASVNSSFTVTAPENSDVDLGTITVVATARDDGDCETGVTATASDSADIVVDAVADAIQITEFSVSDSLGDGNTTFDAREVGSLRIAAISGDILDGSETHSVTIELPEGFVFTEEAPGESVLTLVDVEMPLDLTIGIEATKDIEDGEVIFSVRVDGVELATVGGDNGASGVEQDETDNTASAEATASATVQVIVPDPELVVGSNADDQEGETTPHTVPSEIAVDGEILGAGGNDILIGDVGGTGSQEVAVNLSYAIDISNSMSYVEVNIPDYEAGANRYSLSGIPEGTRVQYGDTFRESVVVTSNGRIILDDDQMGDLIFMLPDSQLKVGQPVINVQVQPVNVVDGSWQNVGEKTTAEVDPKLSGLVEAKEAFTALHNSLRNQVANNELTTFQLVAFNSGVVVDSVFTYNPVSDLFENESGDSLQDVIDSLGAEGTTEFENPLQAIEDFLNDGGRHQGALNKVYFLSDGIDLTGYDGSVDFTDIDVSIQAFGVGTLTDEDQLAQVAGEGNEDSDVVIVEDPTQLAAVLGDQTIAIPDEVGEDHISGGDRDDLIFGDVINADWMLGSVEDGGFGAAGNPGDGYQIIVDHLTATLGHDPSKLEVITFILDNQDRFVAEAARDSRGEADLLEGGDGDDILLGQGGADILIAGEGDDQLYGGADGDTFVFSLAADEGTNTILDFSASEGDRLSFEDVVDGDDVGNDVDINDVLVDGGFSKDGSIVTLELKSGTMVVFDDLDDAIKTESDLETYALINGV